MRDFPNTLMTSAIFATMTLGSTPSWAVVVASPRPARAAVEFDQLVRLDLSLRRALRVEEQRLVTSCEFDSVRLRLTEISGHAGGAIRELGGFPREGQFRSGELAMSETLLHSFVALRDDAGRDRLLAETLGRLRRAALDGSRDAREKIGQIIAKHPAPPTCLTRDLDERGTAGRAGLPKRDSIAR